MIVKIYKSTRQVVALCDSHLLDKIFQEENSQRQLDMTTTFFKGEEKSNEEIKEILQNAKIEDATFNIVGEQSCHLAKELGVIDDNSIIKICNIPVALVFL